MKKKNQQTSPNAKKLNKKQQQTKQQTQKKPANPKKTDQKKPPDQKQSQDKSPKDKNKKQSHLPSKTQVNQMKKDLQNKLSYVDKKMGWMVETDSNYRTLDDGERLKFVAEVSKERKLLQKKRLKQLKQMQEKDEEERKKLEEEKRKEQKQLLQKRRYQIQKRTSERDLLRKKKDEENERQNQILKKKLREKNLSDRLSEKFRQTENQTLEERKRKLAEIRSLHKPLSKNQFDDHLQKIQELKGQVEKTESQLMSSRILSLESRKFYKSVWYHKEQEKQVLFEDDKHVKDLFNAKEMKDKQIKYSEYVRQNFVPEVNQKKLKEMAKRKKKAEEAAKKKVEKDGRLLGLRYLEFSKEQGDSAKNQNQEKQVQKAFKYMNYLEDLKKSRDKIGSKSSQNFVETIKGKKDLSSPEKARRILEYVDKVERKAKMREEKGKANNMLVDEEVDKLYLEAIQAKLSMFPKN